MAALIVAPFIVVAQPCSLSLSGHVEDASTKEKLASAVVSIRGTLYQTITNERGDFRFTGLCAGRYTVVISHVNCDSVVREMDLQKDQHMDVFLPHALKTLGEVVVESRKGTPNTGFKKELSGKQLEETRGQSLAEALSRMNGVTMLQTGSTISKPVIHGLHSSRILMINNGVRQEGQQWGNEHAPEIDPFIANRLTVIKGVDELKYGSDAIAGVILVEPRALRSSPGYNAEFNTGYSTNNRQMVFSGIWEQQLKSLPAFTYRLQGTFKKGANATTPDYRLNNTGAEERNFSITAGWRKQNFQTELFYSQFATKLGIFKGSHIGNLTDLQNAIDASRPANVFTGENTYRIDRPYQQVMHQLIKSKSTLRAGDHKFNLSLAGQFNQREEFDIVRSSTNNRPQLDLSIYTISEDLNWEHPRKNNFTGTVGFSMAQQRNRYSGRYFIPNYEAYTFGGYWIEKWNRHNWELQAGVRYDYKMIETRRLKFNGDTLDHDFSFSTLASSLNANLKASSNWDLNLGVSLSSRAPYVNELLSDGLHHGTANYEKGDINLKPERSLSLSSGIRFHNTENTFQADILLHANFIKDFIYQQPRPDSPVLTIAGAFPLLEYQQTDALLTGIDLSTAWNPLRAIQFNTKLAILYGRNRTTRDWLILMPANRLSGEISYSFADKGAFTGNYISAEWVGVDRQRRTPDETDRKQDYKAPPAAYQLVNLQASTTFQLGGWPFTLGAGVRNLFNTRYRDYLNSMRYFTDEMGRNISLRLKISFEKMDHK
jgi:iron complex outermembrane recepter protein